MSLPLPASLSVLCNLHVCLAVSLPSVQLNAGFITLGDLFIYLFAQIVNIHLSFQYICTVFMHVFGSEFGLEDALTPCCPQSRGLCGLEVISLR